MDFLCLAVPPPSWSVTHSQDVSTTGLLYICQGKYWHSNLFGKGSLQSRVCPQHLTKELASRRHFTLTCQYNQYGEPYKRTICHHISYYCNTPGPRGGPKHKKTDDFIEDTVTHSVKSACREMAGCELGKTNRFGNVFLSSIQSVKEWLFCSDSKRWYFCGRDIYIYIFTLSEFFQLSLASNLCSEGSSLLWTMKSVTFLKAAVKADVRGQ